MDDTKTISQRRKFNAKQRFRRTLESNTNLILILCPFAVATLTGGALWGLLGSVFGLNSNQTVGTASVAFVTVLFCGVMISLFLRSMFKRYNLLRSALNVVDAPLILFDGSNKVFQFNRSAFQYHQKRGTNLRIGMSESALVKLAASRRVDGLVEQQEWVDRVTALRKEHLDSGEPMTVETRELQAGDQDARVVHQQVLLARVLDGFTVEMRTDVTALKQKEITLAEREADLKTSRNEAQASNRAKSEFLANMSHEIRTPMNGVVGMTELLLESELTSQQRMYASTISSSSLALLSLINDILDFSKVEAGEFQIEPIAFDLKEVFDDISLMLATKAQSKGVELTTNYASELPSRFIGDADRIRQVINNLAGNAVKFTDEGHVSIDVSGVVNDDLASLVVTIKDTGIGIPENQQESIFSVFEQVDGASNRRFEGTGLGLAIARRLVNLMGGDITLKSTFGEGSQFKFELCLLVDLNNNVTEVPARSIDSVSVVAANDANMNAAVVDLAQASDGKRVEVNEHPGINILIVEDNPVNQLVISSMLESREYVFDIADNGALGVEAYIAQPPDLILMDICMPEMNGMEATQRIRDHESTHDLRHCPIIALTANAMKGDRERFIASGMDDFLSKPVMMEALFSKIDLLTDSELPVVKRRSNSG